MEPTTHSPVVLQETLRRRLRARFILLLLGMSAGLLVVLGAGLYQLYAEYGRTSVGKAGLHTSEAVGSFFKPVGKILTVSRAWVESGLLHEPEKPEMLARGFLPLLDPIGQVTGMMLAWTNGVEAALLRDGAEWTARISRPENGQAHQEWTRLKADYTPVEQGARTIEYDPRERPWFTGALALPSDQSVYWTEPYPFFTLRKMGITVAAPCRTIGSAEPDLVLGFDVLLEDFQRLMEDVELVQGGRVFLLSDAGAMITLPGGEDSEEKQPGIVTVAVKTWLGQDMALEAPFRFRHQGQTWWAEVRSLQLGDQVLHTGVIFSGSDVRGGAKPWAIVLFTVLIAVGGVGAGALVVRSYGRRMQAAQALTGPDPAEIQSLIAGGEAAHLEFKSSLRWDYRQEKLNKKLEEVILKSIAAFNNSEGGTLLIGVSDEGTLLGLEPDYGSLKEFGKDYFELHLRNLVTQEYGLEFGTRNLHIQFPTAGDVEICSVHILRGTAPLYTPVTDKQGQKHERFFIRSGNASRELRRPSEIMDYVQQRFP